jgi:hypothetical protein
MDRQCAGMHSHNTMMQGMDAKSDKECTQKCVQQLGRKYTLFDKSANTAYQLDNQEKAPGFAGQTVSVKGTYDAARAIRSPFGDNMKSMVSPAESMAR